jgi:RHS repeat-associated protein
VYNPYGTFTIYEPDWSSTRAISSVENSILFHGYLFDIETKNSYARNRYYHSTLGTWLSRDPLGYVDGLNLFMFCKDSPLVFSDPFGTDAKADCERTAKRNLEIREFRCFDESEKQQKECGTLKGRAQSDCYVKANEQLNNCRKTNEEMTKADRAACEAGRRCPPENCSEKANPCFDTREKENQECDKWFNEAPIGNEEMRRSREVVRKQCKDKASENFTNCLRAAGCARGAK